MLQDNIPLSTIRISLDTGLYNAGILGLIQLLELANQQYWIDGQVLIIPLEFFLREDLNNLYLDLMFGHYQAGSRYKRLINTDFDTCDEKVIESFNGLFKGKTQSSICATYGDNGLDEPCKEYSKITQKAAYDRKRELGKFIQSYLYDRPNLYRQLVIGDSARTQLSDFFGTFAFLKVSQGSYLLKNDTKFEEELDSFLFNKIREFASNYEDYHNDDGKVQCIQCREISVKSKGQLVDMRFLNDFVDSPDKKKSVFWDKSADAVVCPICAMVYSLMPFGFREVRKGGGFLKDKVFVNDNDSVKRLRARNLTDKVDEEHQEQDKLGIINNIILAELENKTKYELNNIELIVRENFDKRSFYSFSVIGRYLLELISRSKENLERLTNVVVKTGDDYLQVFPEVLNNILSYNNQWLLIDKLLRIDASMYAINNVFQIQINKSQLKEEKMKELDGKIKSARYAGKALKDIFGVEAENKLRGYVYRLVNALSTGNRDMFLDSITRMYSGINLEIPNVLINVFVDDEAFKEIGYAYVFGLKTEDYSKNKKEN